MLNIAEEFHLLSVMYYLRRNVNVIFIISIDLFVCLVSNITEERVNRFSWNFEVDYHTRNNLGHLTPQIEDFVFYILGPCLLETMQKLDGFSWNFQYISDISQGTIV